MKIKCKNLFLKICLEFHTFFKKFYPPVAASNNAHSHLSRSPQYGHMQ